MKLSIFQPSTFLYNILIIIFNLFTSITQAQIVSTLAGSGSEGDINGNGMFASFAQPNGIVVDKKGNVYLADGNANKIKKITPFGEVSTFAGSGYIGNTDGTGTSASFHSPWGLAIDSKDNLYVGDYFNYKVRKITPSGEVTTLAGSGKWGNTNGPGEVASFSYPHSLAIDTSNNVYVADWFNNLIRKITPEGFVSTYAGNGNYATVNGTALNASFSAPLSLVFDKTGNLYVSDNDNNIRMITNKGIVSTLAGKNSRGNEDGTIENARFSSPTGLAIDIQGNIYVADGSNNKIRIITPNGIVSTFAGTGIAGDLDGMASNASFNFPISLALDSDNNMYISERGNFKVKKISSIVLNAASEINNPFKGLYLFPNPTKNSITIGGMDNYYDCFLSDISGVVSEIHQTSTNTYDIETLNPGIYFLKINSISGQNKVLKIIKE